MALTSKNPAFTLYLMEWELLDICYQGENAVKLAGDKYLPPTQSQVIDGATKDIQSIGAANYAAYKLRAQFPDYVKDAVEIAVGMMHSEDAVIELPSALEPLRENATAQGETLQDLLRRVNEQQLVTGRCGLFADLAENPDQTNPIPYLSLYKALRIPNWDISSTSDNTDILNMVILDESGAQRQSDFQWKEVKKYRVLMLTPSATDENGVAQIVANPEDYDPSQVTNIYVFGVFNDTTQFNPTVMKPAIIRGVPSEVIPFQFINAKDNLSDPDVPPLLGLANLCMSIYRSEADYRQNLYMQGQDTFVISGAVLNDKPDGADGGATGTRTGAGALLELDVGGDAKYVGVESSGLEEQRTALENDRKLAATKSVQVRGNDDSSAESGTSRRVRIGAETANLTQIAKTGAAGLENLLKNMAIWMGANPEEVSVVANTNFSQEEIEGRILVDIMTSKNMGNPISLQSIHRLMNERGITDKTFEEELEAIEEEMDVMPMPRGTEEGGNPNENENTDNNGDQA